MGKVYMWDIPGEQSTHNIKIEIKNFTGNHVVTVDGETKTLRPGFKEKMLGIDVPLSIEGKDLHLVVQGNKADVAVDGYYLESKKEYTPLMSMPKWAYIFIVLSLGVPVYTMGGAIPAVIGVLGAMYSAKVSVNQSLSEPIRIGLAALCTTAAWVVMLLFVNLMLSLLA